VIKVTEARKTILKEGKEGGKNDYINIENVGNTSLHVVVSNDKGHVITHDLEKEWFMTLYPESFVKDKLYIKFSNAKKADIFVCFHKTGKTIFAVFFTVFSFPFNCNIPFGLKK
jgi:hypothetical protein